MRILYYLILLPVSILPNWALYRISDAMYWTVYRLVGYRTKVVRANIRNSFPDWPKEYCKGIEHKFYVHFCDMVVEAIKTFSISKKELAQRITHRNPGLLQEYFDKGQHITLVGGHYGNWELFIASTGMHFSHQPLALYTPLHNKFMNKKLTKSRSRFGVWMKGYQEAKEVVKSGTTGPVAFIFGSDQSPSITQKPYWTNFLCQETGVLFGAEKFARDNNTPVVYWFIHKMKRGCYEVEYRLLCEKPGSLEKGMITEAHTRMLEDDIRKAPAYWLWTHKRWKRNKSDFEAYEKEKNEDKNICKRPAIN